MNTALPSDSFRKGNDWNGSSAMTSCCRSRSESTASDGKPRDDRQGTIIAALANGGAVDADFLNTMRGDRPDSSSEPRAAGTETQSRTNTLQRMIKYHNREMPIRVPHPSLTLY